MKDQDYIRAGIERAKGWSMPTSSEVLAPLVEICTLRCMSGVYKEALAAQLVRQYSAAYPDKPRPGFMPSVFYNDDPLDTIKYVVDSEVLK